MARNFYVVLGVSRDADPLEIRKAHRRLVRLYHPDTSNGSVDRFTEIQKAFETLADEDSKRQYDESLKPARVPVQRRPRAESRDLSPTRDFSRNPVSIRESAPGLYSDIDEFLDGWLPGLFTTGPTASRRKDIYVEIILDPAEADRGGLFPLEIRVRQQCQNCGATGYCGMFLCRHCRGRGVVQGHREVEISMPAKVSDGTKARLSLEDIGLKGVDLNVLVSIQH